MTKGLMIITLYYSICFIVFFSFLFNLITTQDIKYNSLVENYNSLVNETTFDERCIMYDRNGLFERYENSNVNGLYFPAEEYYMVWVKDRNISEIEETDRHEYCHNLIDKDKEKHFCK